MKACVGHLKICSQETHNCLYSFTQNHGTITDNKTTVRITPASYGAFRKAREKQEIGKVQ